MSTLKWEGTAVKNNIGKAVRQALRDIGYDLKDKSVNRAPIDTGKLRKSCRVDRSELAKNCIIRVGYSPDVDHYSVIQHERLDFNHPRGGEAKYLENPFNENRERYT